VPQRYGVAAVAFFVELQCNSILGKKKQQKK
jgi:hypothetical protein